MKDRDPKYPGRIQLVPVDTANGIYDVVRADVPTEKGTPLNRATLLSAQACKDVLADPSAATPSDMFQAVKKAAQVGTIIQSVRTDLGDAWALCNGDMVDQKKYSRLCEHLDFLSVNNSAAHGVNGVSGEHFSGPCYGNGKYVLIGYSYKNYNYAWDFYESDDGVNYVNVRRGTESTEQNRVVGLGHLFYDGAKFWFANYYDRYLNLYRFSDPKETMTLVGSYKTQSGSMGIFMYEQNILIFCPDTWVYMLVSKDGGESFTLSSINSSFVSQSGGSYYCVNTVQIQKYVYFCTYWNSSSSSPWYVDVSRFDLEDLSNPEKVFSSSTTSRLAISHFFTDNKNIYASTDDGRVIYAPANNDKNWKEVSVGQNVIDYVDGFYLAENNYYTKDLFSGNWETNKNSNISTLQKIISESGDCILYGGCYVLRGYYLPTISSMSTTDQKDRFYIKVKEE